MKKNKRKSLSSNKKTNLPASSVQGVVTLLDAARACARESCDDGVCLVLLDQCISHLTASYGLPARSADGNTDSTKTSIEALVCLLTYVSEEVTEILRDERGGNLIKRCIDHILQTHVRPSRPHEGARLVH